MSYRVIRKIAGIAALAAFLPAAAQAQAQQDNLESVMWQLVSQSGDAAQIASFVEKFPDSEHAESAKAMLDMMETRESQYALEDSIFQSIGNVAYAEPLAFGNENLIGLTLPQLMENSPQYPPVAGLPDEYWKDKSCQSCHQWTREALCTQASTYVDMDPARYREKMHPFGGLLKINLRNWAQNDCQ